MISMVLAALIAAAPEVESPATSEPASTNTSRVDRRLIDLSADMLDPGEWQFNIVGAVYSRGLFRRLSLSTSMLLDAATFLNLNARLLLVDDPQIRVTAELGGGYFVLGHWIETVAYHVPAELRSTIPVAENWNVSTALKYRALGFDRKEVAMNFHSFVWASNIVRYDRSGAFFAELTMPLANITRSRSTFQGLDLAGTLVLDNVPAWGVLVGRDQRIGKSAHLRFGVGYRHKPGIIVVDSIGNLMATLDLYWR